MSERARKEAYAWVAGAIDRRLAMRPDDDEVGESPEVATEVLRIGAALRAASQVEPSPEPESDLSTSRPGGLAGVPPPAGGPAVPPTVGAVESSEHSAARQAPREQEPAAVRGQEGAPERPPPAPTSRECADVARWLSLGQPEDERGLLAARFRAHLLECPTCGDRAFRHLADAARST